MKTMHERIAEEERITNENLEKRFESLLKELRKLNDDERLWIFRRFCHECGSTDSTCQCWNDE